VLGVIRVSRAAILALGLVVLVVLALLFAGVGAAKVAVVVAVLALVANVVYVVATLRIAQISQKALDAQIQPILLDVPFDLSIEDKPKFPTHPIAAVHRGGVHVAATPEGQAQCSLPVVNLGRGPARITGIVVQLPTRDGPTITGEPHFRKIERPNLPPDEMTRINFAFQGGDTGWSEWYLAVDPANRVGRFSVDVDYTNYAGGEPTTTRFVIAHDPDGYFYKWGVETTELLTAAA
jgi:hypothetical protein